MGLEAKRTDEDSNSRAPLCEMCKNRQMHELSRQQPALTCVKVGTIPRELILAKTYHCDYFALEDDKSEMYIEILSSGLEFDID